MHFRTLGSSPFRMACKHTYPQDPSRPARIRHALMVPSDSVRQQLSVRTRGWLCGYRDPSERRNPRVPVSAPVPVSPSSVGGLQRPRRPLHRRRRGDRGGDQGDGSSNSNRSSRTP